MDAFFNAYKARYEILDSHFDQIERTQHIKSIDIFINLDDFIHKLHRPNIEHEFELCGMLAPNQCTSNIINLAAHYKMWAAKRKLPCRIYMIYTSSAGHFKNSLYVKEYRKHFAEIMDAGNMKFRLLNFTLGRALTTAHVICNYVPDIHMINSGMTEPSIVPLYLKEGKTADYNWSMIVSRDLYDLQYAYRDKWTFVSPKGDNTSVITRTSMWDYIANRERVDASKHHASLYHHDVYPMALAVAGDKFRNIPRLKRIGWKTLFGYLDTITETDTVSGVVMVNRFLELLSSKHVDSDATYHNYMATNIISQVGTMSDIMKTSIHDQITYVNDVDSLNRANQLYFEKFPINIPFLLASTRPGPFSF